MKKFIKNSLGWGFILWLIGYVLGIVLFKAVSPSYLGWVIMPFGIIITLWVLFKKIVGDTIKYYFFVGLVWAAIALVFDYFFLVKALKPEDGYYKLDVYIYYALTLILPLLVGWFKTRKPKETKQVI